jgi:hypothetical protein
MDRDRLKEIQTADVSESKVNEDFIHWMKTKGPGYLLIVMLLIAGYMFMLQYQQGKDSHRADAWDAYLEARVSGLPTSHEDVAQTYADVDSIEALGILSAADAYLQSVVLGKTVGSNANISTTLTIEDRTFYLQKADGLYGAVVANDDLSEAITLLIVSGLNGRAAVAEAQGNIESAKGYYEAVIARVGDQYPILAVQARIRLETVDTLVDAIDLPSDVEVTARNNQVLRRNPDPVNTMIEALNNITDAGGE